MLTIAKSGSYNHFQSAHITQVSTRKHVKTSTHMHEIDPRQGEPRLNFYRLPPFARNRLGRKHDARKSAGLEDEGIWLGVCRDLDDGASVSYPVVCIPTRIANTHERRRRTFNEVIQHEPARDTPPAYPLKLPSA